LKEDRRLTLKMQEQKRRKIRIKKERHPPGPKPDTLKIEGSWKEAVKNSLEKKKPKEGWPK
jgi:hypothetical protein